MPWDYILGSAGGAGVVLVLGILLAKQFIEKVVETKFATKLEEFRAEQNRKLEELRGEQNLKLEGVRGEQSRKLEGLRADLTRKLEFDKSDLSVWADLRKDILTEMWKAHRDIVKQMTAVILSVQNLQSNKKRNGLKPDIDECRKMIHSQIDLLSPQAISIGQRFIDIAHDIVEGTKEPEDGNPLKTIRGEFYAYTAKLYGLESMMPWIARNEKERN